MGFGFRFRRSVKLAPGIRLNFNKKSTGITLGGKAERMTLNSKGQRTTSVRTGIKGLSMQSRSKKRR